MTSTMKGFLGDSPAESGAERDQTFPQPCPLNTHFSSGFCQYVSLNFVFFLWVKAALSVDSSKPGARISRFTSPAAPPPRDGCFWELLSSGPICPIYLSTVCQFADFTLHSCPRTWMLRRAAHSRCEVGALVTWEHTWLRTRPTGSLNRGLDLPRNWCGQGGKIKCFSHQMRL